MTVQDPRTGSATRTYVERVRGVLGDLSHRDVDDALADLEANVLAEAAARGGTPAAEAAVLEALGTPEEYATALREALAAGAGAPLPQGRVLGMPFEFRQPTANSITERIWNPADPRIWMPRSFGVGWTINFGALAVKLGIIRPDDTEERPFEHVPSSALRLAAAFPLLLGALAIAIVAIWWRELPAMVPVHWGVNGAPDGWATREVALGALIAVAALLPAVLFGRLALKGAERRSIAITSVVLSLSSWLAAGLCGYTVVTALTGFAAWWVPLMIVLTAIAMPFVMLVVLSRASLKAEWRDALGDTAGRTPKEGTHR
ncbi:MAG TPA: DUF1648 domain-containing protein [Coriobacteriia bacterium]|nr:DUF1648 domain-containing protein [Coriobacteriia bacterium]